jgi:hypothetical protein
METDECMSAFREFVKAEKSKQWNKEKKEIRTKLKTKSEYEKDLQVLINKIVRLIDKNTVCISTQKPLNDKFDAGHFYSVGSSPELRFNLFNIYAQSVYANQYLSGDQINFMNGLEAIYSKEVKDMVLNLKVDYKPLKLQIIDIEKAIQVAKSIVKHLELENKPMYTPQERIFLRGKFNKMIGIH